MPKELAFFAAVIFFIFAIALNSGWFLLAALAFVLVGLLA